MLDACLDAGLPAALVNPARVRHFARSLGRQAKNDRIDARTLVRFGLSHQPRHRLSLSEKRSATQAQLSELVTCRQQWVEARAIHTNQLARATLKAAKAAHERMIRQLDGQVKDLEKKIATLISDDDDLSRRDTLLRSVPGVGAVLASTLLCRMSELGRIEHRPLSALIGVAPFDNDSGRTRGRRGIRGGRATVRRVLFMGTLTAVRMNPVIKAHYQQLRARGLAFKTAMVSCMRKLARILNAIVRDQKAWEPRQPKTA